MTTGRAAGGATGGGDALADALDEAVGSTCGALVPGTSALGCPFGGRPGGSPYEAVMGAAGDAVAGACDWTSKSEATPATLASPPMIPISNGTGAARFLASAGPPRSLEVGAPVAMIDGGCRSVGASPCPGLWIVGASAWTMSRLTTIAGDAAGPGASGAFIPAVAVRAARIAACMARASGNRLSRSLASARFTARETGGGTHTTVSSGGASRVMAASITFCTVSASCT